ncbi:MAG: enoyl-CoA hydratase [Alphaproteobacteria bacterium]
MPDDIQSRTEGPIRWLIFNRPDKHNAMSLEMTQAAHAVIEDFASNDAERVLIVTGSGGKAFISGADISEFDSNRGNADDAARYSDMTNRMFFSLRDVEKPTIAMIDGICFGGGVALATCCDLRFCSEASRFSVPAARLGVGYSPDYVKFLQDIVGPARTKEILFTARRYGAQEAFEMGLVNRVFGDNDLRPEVRAIAETIAGNAPLTIRAAKLSVAELVKPDGERDMSKPQAAVADCMDSTDFKNARRAFMAKEKPVFEGR